MDTTKVCAPVENCLYNKSTTIADKLGMPTLDNKRCKCRAKVKYRGGISPSELGRYGAELMSIIADKIEKPTPSAQAP